MSQMEGPAACGQPETRPGMGWGESEGKGLGEQDVHCGISGLKPGFDIHSMAWGVCRGLEPWGPIPLRRKVCPRHCVAPGRSVTDSSVLPYTGGPPDTVPRTLQYPSSGRLRSESVAWTHLRNGPIPACAPPGPGSLVSVVTFCPAHVAPGADSPLLSTGLQH